jgi:hypothetical protein
MVRLVKTTNWMENVQNFEVEINGVSKVISQVDGAEVDPKNVSCYPPTDSGSELFGRKQQKKGTKRREGTTWGGWWRRFRKVCRA